MKKRRLGKTDLCVSEIGFGGEWLERHTEEEGIELIRYASSQGINILDCWMPDPKSRNIIGEAIKENRGEWYIQGHIGSTWKDEQYYRTREMEYVRPAFEDLLARLQTDYIDLGMILFSINPAFDMLPASENIDDMFAEEFDEKLKGIDPERALLYQTCEQNDVGITVMKGFAGGRLFSEKSSPFGVSLTPVQCIHYALTRPAVCSILCGYDTKEQVDAAASYETATDDEKDYASVIASAPLHSYKGQCTYCGHCRPCPKDIDIAMVNKFYDLATMQSEVPESVRSHYELLEHHASECIGCKGCESRCPFSVEIAERMRKTAELFGK